MKKLLFFLMVIVIQHGYAQNDTIYPPSTYVDPAFFDESELLVSWEETFCAIKVNGTDTTFAPCYIVTYRDHYETSISLCPDNLDEVGGMGLFNGDPRLLDASLFEDMEADGSNIIDDADDYSINYNNLTTGEKSGTGGDAKYCIEAELYEGTNNTWFQKVMILTGPIDKPGAAINYHTAETIGLLKNGMILEHTPPSSESTAAMVGGIIPVDYCGWHPEPAGFGHFHAIPTGINVALEANGFSTEYFCVDIDQEDGSGFVGFTLSGLPIYGPYDADGSIPSDLDECNGHEGTTVEFPSGVYHYHASATEIINNPTCYAYYAPLEEERFTYGEWTSSAPSTPGSIDGLSEVCENEAGVEYSISAVATATTYNWTVPDGATIISGEGNTSIVVDFGSAVGDVCVSASSDAGTSASQCLTITAASCSTAPNTPGSIEGLTTVCPDQTGVAYSISAVSGADNYNWTVPSGAEITSGSGTTSITVTFSGSVGTICVNAENSTGTSSDQCITISEGTCSTAPDTPGVIEGSTAVCANQVGIVYSIADVTGADSYTWIVPNDAEVVSGAGTTSITVTFGAIIGNICVSATNSVGTSADQCLTIAESASCAAEPGTPGTIEGLTSVCPNQPNVTYSITAVEAADTYTWTVPTGATIVSGQGSTSITVDYGSEVGNVCVNAENSIGTSADQCLAITAASCGSAPDTPGAIDGLASVCSDETGVVYSISAVAMTTDYNWTVPTGATIVSGQGSISITVDFGSEVGEVCVNAENPIGTSADQCLTIATSSTCGSIPDTPSTIDGLSEICANQTGVTFSIAAVAGTTTYNWKVPPMATITSGQGTTSIIVDFGEVVGKVCVNAGNSVGFSMDQCLTLALCSITSVDDLIENSELLRIYPNPVSNRNLKLIGAYDWYTIFDINGTTVLESSKASSMNETSLDLIKLDAGIYFINVQKNNVVLFERIILE